MLQFITNENSSLSPAGQILGAIEGGCKWVQIRLKEASDDDIRALFLDIRDKARENEVTVIINDRVELALSLASEGVAGVHLGMNDMPAAEAREKLGPDAIIGVTAHSFDEAKAYKGLDVDYIGIGPFAHTDTKKDLAPVIGLEGIVEIADQAKGIGLDLPLVAVGGVTLDDVESLLKAGADGIAVSGAIANAGDVAEATRQFIKALPLDE